MQPGASHPFLDRPVTPTPGITPSATPNPAPLPSPSPPPVSSYQPLFQSAPCAFPIPAGTQPDCGYLIVPEDRARPDGAQVRLHVAIFHSTADHPAPDPVVHLAGGPGSSSLGSAVYMFNHGLGEILAQRDLILFDQRGTGYSQPRLDCPERNALTPALLDGSLSAEQSNQAILDAYRRCRDRLVAQGIDLKAYTSAASAADVNDLRIALGYPAFDLYGDSYGTRLALTVMRDFPQAVRSALLDSVYPPQVNLYTSLASNAQRAFDTFFAGCAIDPYCSQHYPNLKTVFYDLVDQLNADPMHVPLTVNRQTYDLQVDGGRLEDVFFTGLYNPLVTIHLPDMIFNIRKGDTKLLQDQLALYFDTSSALGMTMSVQCSEEIPFASPQDAYTQAQGLQPQIAAFFPDSVQWLFSVCQDWPTAPPDPRENQPVSSDLPALILAGEMDPITPPDWGKLAAETLPNAHFYEFPVNGHWVMRSSSCAVQIALSFWDQPSQTPDHSCLK